MSVSFENSSEALGVLSAAYAKGELSLYLGAGVSVGSGIPDWEQLVAAMYFVSLAEDSDQHELRWAYRNYLFAIADWFLARERQPMDVTARKVRAFFDGAGYTGNFLPVLKDTLYASLTAYPGDEPEEDAPSIRAANTTLEAVAELCERKNGVASVISYNYDNLLELSLKGRRAVQPIWKASQSRRAGVLPCYHVHGYIPIRGRGSTNREIIFTEEQFHSAANTAYSWSNIVQLRQMASGIGLAIGLSLNDRNLRRLLDAVANTPLSPRVYAVLEKRPPAKVLKADRTGFTASRSSTWRDSRSEPA